MTLKKNLALSEEINISIMLIERGLAELQRYNSNESNGYYAFLFYLATGSERLLKSMMCMGYYNETQTFPSTNELKNFAGGNGHDLEKLLNNFIEKYYGANNERQNWDKAFLQSDTFLDFYRIISKFGQKARFTNLDIITGNDDEVNGFYDIEKNWHEYESELFSHYGLEAKLYTTPDATSIYKEFTNILVKMIEQFLRAMYMQFTNGKLDDLGRLNSSTHIRNFNKQGSDFGKWKY